MKKIIEYIASAALSSVQVVVDGLSSARQIIDFTSAPGIRYAACCGGLVEGEIYRKNIIEGYEKFNLLNARALWSHLLLLHFETALAANEQLWTYSFCASYKANKDFLQRATLFKVDKTELENAKTRLKLLQKVLIDRIVYQQNWEFLTQELVQNDKDGNVTECTDKSRHRKLPLPDIDPALLNELQDEFSRIKLRLWPLRFGMLFSVFTGIMIGVVTFYTFPAVLTGLGLSLSLTLLSAVIWPLAILSAISYAILIYNTLADVIIHESLTKWWQGLHIEIARHYGELNLFKYTFLLLGKILTSLCVAASAWLKKKDLENWFNYSVRMTLSLLVIVFGIIASIATGYTAFIQLQDYINIAVCIITALPLFLGDLIFTLKNSFDSISLLTGISFADLMHTIRQSYTKLQNQIQTENYLQLILHLFRLPLKFVLAAFKLTIFLCHVFFVSVACDRFFNFPCWLTLIFTMGSELLTDICPLFGRKEAQHNHEHGGIFDWLAKLIFLVPATLLGLFNCFLSQINSLFLNSELRVLSLWDAIQQEWQQFEIQHPHHKEKAENGILQIDPSARLPQQVLAQKAIKICSNQIDRLGHCFFKTAREKKQIFIEYQEELINCYKTGLQMIPSVNDEAREILNRHRFFNSKKPTESIRKLSKIEDLFHTTMKCSATSA
jgi:hypothetical protein